MPGELRGLLDLLGPPAGDGSYPLKIAGTLASPLLQSPGGARVPEAAPAAGVQGGEGAPEVTPAVGVQGGEGAADAPAASTFGSKRRRAAESDADDE
jgi:hypothetical protein